MSEQRIPPQIRISNAIDQDISDTKITLNLIERLTEQSNHPKTLAFSSEELQTLIRNCTHAIILHLTKTIEKPIDKTINGEKVQTYNLESLIKDECPAEDQDKLKQEFCYIRSDHIYQKLVRYRHNIIAHRNMKYSSYQAIEQEFVKCKDYLLENKKHIEKLIDKIHSLQMDIKNSRNKKRRLPTD